MQAIILSDNAEYVSHIFAVKNSALNGEVIAFDKDLTHIRRIKTRQRRGRVYILGGEKFNCSKQAWEGYDWVLRDEKLWKKMRFGRKADLKDFPQFKKYAKEIALPQWFEINDESDIQSLMNLAADFCSSAIIGSEKDGDNIVLRLDTMGDCFITLKFLGVRGSAFVEDTGIIYAADIEKRGDGFIWKITDFIPKKTDEGEGSLSDTGKPYIACDKILWSIKTERRKLNARRYLYDNIYDMYCNLKALSENVVFKDGKIIAYYKTDTLAVENSPKGYKVYLNGNMLKEKWEEQDVEEYVSDFLTQVDADDIEEEILADAKSVKSLYVLHCLRYPILFSVLWIVSGFLLAFFAHMSWVLFAVLFCAPSLYVIFVVLYVTVRRREIRYIITPTKIYYFFGDKAEQILDISEIKSVKLNICSVKKDVGTIKLRSKSGLIFGCSLIAINEVKKVYNLLGKIIGG